MKSKQSTNLLYRRFRKFLKSAGFVIETYNQNTIIVKSGKLSNLVFRFDKNYCYVFNPLWVTVRVSHSLSLCVNYSIEALLYGLYKFKKINVDTYSELVKSISYGKAKAAIAA